MYADFLLFLGDVGAIESFLWQGVSVNEQGLNKQTALHFAAKRGTAHITILWNKFYLKKNISI